MSFDRDRQAMERSAQKILLQERKNGNNKITHEQIKKRIVQALRVTNDD